MTINFDPLPSWGLKSFVAITIQRVKDVVVVLWILSTIYTNSEHILNTFSVMYACMLNIAIR